MYEIGSQDRILVTGGAGFIGSHLVARLAETGAQIRVLDNFDRFYAGKEKNLERFSHLDNVQVIRGSILDRRVIRSLCRWSTLVFHEAAQAGIRYCDRHPLKAHRVNVSGTINLLSACKAADPGPRRIVNASSSSVYGNVERLPIGEDDPKKPTSIYAATKLAAEDYCFSFHEAFSMDVVSLRYFSVYGPSQRPDLVISTFARNLTQRVRPIVYGDGTHSRDFTYVLDIVEGTVLAAQADDVSGEVFNLGKGERTTVMDLLTMLSKLLGIQDPRPVHRPQFPGEFAHTQADISLARRKLGYHPRVSLREGLERYLQWYLSRQKETK